MGYHLLRFPIERGARQVSRPSFTVKTLMLSLVTRLVSIGKHLTVLTSYALSARTTKRRQRWCLHDTGATFIPARVHPGSLLWLCIRLYDTATKCHAGASRTGASSPRFLCRTEIFIPARKFIPVSCKHGMTVRFIFIEVSSILRHYKTRSPINTALCKHGATFHLAPE